MGNNSPLFSKDSGNKGQPSQEYSIEMDIAEAVTNSHKKIAQASRSYQGLAQNRLARNICHGSLISNYDGLEDRCDERDLQEVHSQYSETSNGKKRKRIRHQQSDSSLPSDGTANNNAEVFILEESANDLQGQHDRIPGTFGRYNRRNGDALPARHRKIYAKLDHSDQLLLEMREKGFSDRQIAEKLSKECHVNYDVKSISTRIMRVRMAQAENVDFLLKEGYKEWKTEEDQLLLQAYALADIEVNYEIERARAWRFRKVSEYMRRLNKNALFSATACRERYKTLVEGSAYIPSAVDDNPEARLAEMAAFRIQREKARSEEEGRSKTKADLQKKTKDEALARNAQKAEEKAQRRAVREAEKAQRAMERATKAQQRAQHASEMQRVHQQRNARTGQQLFTSKSSETGGRPLASVGEDFLFDPRGFLSLPDLRQLCANRGLEVEAKTMNQLLHDVQNADRGCSLADLMYMCDLQGLNTTGNKAILSQRLALATAQSFPSFDSEMAASHFKRDGDQEGENDYADGALYDSSEEYTIDTYRYQWGS